jgi:hypothetical protein
MLTAEEALTQQRGDAWHRARSTPLLHVPSAIMPLRPLTGGIEGGGCDCLGA